MADYRAWQGIGEALQTGGDAFSKARAAKLQAEKDAAAVERQAKMDKQTQDQLGITNQGLAADRATKASQFEQEMQLKRDQMAQADKLARLKVGGVDNMPMTPGRKAADMAFGKDYIDYNTQGRPAIEKGLNTLEEARQELKDKGNDITGPIRGAMPDFIRAFTNPEAVAVKERIRGAVQNTLKATLGAQFTEKEGERIFNNAYNDRLSPEENMNRLDKIIAELKGGRDAKENMGTYFEQKGTLTGYKGTSSPRHNALAEQILNDPEAGPDDIAWAKSQMGK